MRQDYSKIQSNSCTFKFNSFLQGITSLEVLKSYQKSQIPPEFYERKNVTPNVFSPPSPNLIQHPLSLHLHPSLFILHFSTFILHYPSFTLHPSVLQKKPEFDIFFSSFYFLFLVGPIYLPSSFLRFTFLFPFFSFVLFSFIFKISYSSLLQVSQQF